MKKDVLYIVSYSGRFGHRFYAVDERQWRKCGGHGFFGAGAVSREELRKQYPNGVLLESPDEVVQAVRIDETGKLGFRQKRYPSRTSFVGPDHEVYDIILPDRSTPVTEGCLYVIGDAVRRIARPGKRGLLFVRVEHHPECCN